MAKKDLKKNKGNKTFFKDFKAELKKVIWPTPEKLFKDTMTVISISLVIALMVFIFDFAFDKINTYGIDKMKNLISSSSSSEESNSEESNNESENKTEENEEKSTANDENNVETENNNIDAENTVNN